MWEIWLHNELIQYPLRHCLNSLWYVGYGLYTYGSILTIWYSPSERQYWLRAQAIPEAHLSYCARWIRPGWSHWVIQPFFFSCSRGYFWQNDAVYFLYITLTYWWFSSARSIITLLLTHWAYVLLALIHRYAWSICCNGTCQMYVWLQGTKQ